MENIGTKAAGTDDNGSTLEVTQGTWQLEQVQCFLQGQRLHALVAGQLGKLWLLAVVSRTNLYHRTETTNLDEDRLAALGIFTQLTLTSLTLLTGIHGLLYCGFELLIEAFQHVGP